MKSHAKTKTCFYYFGYVIIKDSKYVKINRVNTLYIIVNKKRGYFEEINKSKYLTLESRKQRENKKEKNMKTCGVKSEINLING